MDLDCFTVAVPKHRSGSDRGPLANATERPRRCGFHKGLHWKISGKMGYSSNPQISDLFKASVLSFMQFTYFTNIYKSSHNVHIGHELQALKGSELCLPKIQ